MERRAGKILTLRRWGSNERRRNRNIADDSHQHKQRSQGKAEAEHGLFGIIKLRIINDAENSSGGCTDCGDIGLPPACDSQAIKKPIKSHKRNVRIQAFAHAPLRNFVKVCCGHAVSLAG